MNDPRAGGPGPPCVPAGVRTDWSSAEARVAAVRGLVETSGPITAEELARAIGFTAEQAFAALEALEGEGTVLRGRFRERPATDQSAPERLALDAGPSAPSPPPEWCHRRLLARIHRLTMAGLRREIEPVDVPTFVRFLVRHHKVAPALRPGGPERTEAGDEQSRIATRQRGGEAEPAAGHGSNRVYEAISQLQGLDIPAACWERDILPARVPGYRPAWLDELCLAGEVAWARLYPPPRDPAAGRPMTAITRNVPVSLYLREDAAWLAAHGARGDDASDDAGKGTLSSPAQQVLELLIEGGPAFATDLIAHTQMLPAQLDEALGELTARGLVTSDGFAGLRALARAAGEENGRSARRGRSPRLVRRRRATGATGRWSARRSACPAGARDGKASPDPRNDPPSPDRSRRPSREGSATHGRSAARERSTVTEQWAWQLLRRWGIVFRDLLQREPGAPRWWELVQVYRRLEARGEIRGGRFVRGVGGEQFATPEAVRMLRDLRGEAASTPSEQGGPAPEGGVGELYVLSAADPLNLTGIVWEGPRVPATAANRIVIRDGRPVAALLGDQVQWLAEPCDAPELHSLLRRENLLRR